MRDKTSVPRRPARALLSLLGRPLCALALAVTVVTVVATGPVAADGGLLGLGGVLGTVTGTVPGVVAAVVPGWDDGYTTSPTEMSAVTEAIGANQLWDRGVTGSGVGVALIDSGVVPVQGLAGAGKVVNGPDLSFESQQPASAYLDTFGHGTHMAGIIAGNDAGGGDFRGVGPGARVARLRLAAYGGAVDVSQVIAAIDWVDQHRNDPGLNIRVLNLSFGTDSLQPYQLDPLTTAVENAWRHGIVVVVSGGNDGTLHGSLTDPATDPYVLAVGAANLDTYGSTTVAPFSSRGSASRSVDVVAPGVSLMSLRNPGSYIDQNHPGAVVDNRFFRGTGTSQAAAVVSGAAALLLSAHPGLTPDQVKTMLKATARPLALLDGKAEGSGMINVNAAAQTALPLGVHQSWAPATGRGSIEQARGGEHVAMNGVDLAGEQDIMASPWVPSIWAPASAAASAWSGGTWNGSGWSGSSWGGTSWAGATTWMGRTWTGRTWTGQTWTGQTWTGRTWTGQTWTGQTWTGRTWTGQTWTGRTWTGLAATSA